MPQIAAVGAEVGADEIQDVLVPVGRRIGQVVDRMVQGTPEDKAPDAIDGGSFKTSILRMRDPYRQPLS